MQNKRLNKTYLLGAGFSKEIAEGPLQNELWQSFEDVYNNELLRNDVPENHKEIRTRCFNELKDFTTKLEFYALKRFDNISEQYESIKTKLKENIEYILTLIDLHISNNVEIKFCKNGVSTDPDPFIPMEYIDKWELEKIRKIINTYLFLVLNKLSCNEMASKFASVVNINDQIITFNYDITLEKCLLNMRKWFPLNGYSGLNRFYVESDKDELIQNDMFSPMQIHKLHGSINWKTISPSFRLNNSTNEFFIMMDDIENQNFFFDCIVGRKPQQSQGYYVGGHDAAWLLPSFIKPFKDKTIFDIWMSALSVILDTDELVIIGYSFRDEDSNSHLLLGNLNKDAKIILINKEPEPIKEKLNNLGFNNIKIYIELGDYINDQDI